MAVLGVPMTGTYSVPTGFILVFNLIVGTGALALPRAFQSAGFILSIILLFISAFISYLCATFINEGMAIANASNYKEQLRRGKIKSPAALRECFQITRQIELGAMVNLFIGEYGIIILNIVTTIYLFGDLAIYSVTVPKSLMNIICASQSQVNSTTICRLEWPLWLDRMAMYRLCVAFFVIIVTPLSAMGVQKTRLLQILTSAFRWSAFTIMIVLACIKWANDPAKEPAKPFKFSGFGALFGTTVYAFMCHHSLPGLITPMKTKHHVNLNLLFIYAFVMTFYILLSLTGSFAFDVVFDVYSLNFLVDVDDPNRNVGFKIIDYYLAFFPVFTLTSNYPIVTNTLVNNLVVLMKVFTQSISREITLSWFGASALGWNPSHLFDYYLCGGAEKRRLLRRKKFDDDVDDEDDETILPKRKDVRHGYMRAVIMIIIILLATLVAMLTTNVLLLATITGSYPGVGVQFIIPSLIAIFGRKYCQRKLHMDVPSAAQSPFKWNVWPYLMFIWAVITVAMVSLNLAGVFH